MNKRAFSVKDYLSQAYRIDQRINSKIEQISSLRDLAAKATSTLGDVPPGGTRNVNRMEDIICKIVDMETEINADIDSLVDLKRKITMIIKSVSNPEYQTILELRYLCFKTWEQIAVDMRHSIHHLYKLHSAALNACSELLKDDT
jgi:hypothetical protein